MFVFLVHLHCDCECLVEPTESQYSYLEYFECGFWKLHCRVFVKLGFKPLVSRLLYTVSYAFTVDFPSRFSLLLLGWYFYCSYKSPWFIYSLWKFLMWIFLWGMNSSFLSIQRLHTLFYFLYHKWWLFFHPK